MADDDNKNQPASRKSFIRLIGEAALHTPNMAVVGAAGVGAVALHSIPVAALGGATYLAMVAWDMVSPEFWKKKNAKSDAAKASASLPEKRELSSAALQEALASVIRAKEQLERTLADTPDGVKSHLTSVILLESELEMRAGTLLRRADAIDRSLRTLGPSSVDGELKRISAAEREATDPGARDQYRHARIAREEQARAMTELKGALERSYANITRIVAVMESLAVKVAHLRAIDDAAMDSATGDMGKELDDVNGELRAFEETLASINV